MIANEQAVRHLDGQIEKIEYLIRLMKDEQDRLMDLKADVESAEDVVYELRVVVPSPGLTE